MKIVFTDVFQDPKHWLGVYCLLKYKVENKGIINKLMMLFVNPRYAWNVAIAQLADSITWENFRPFMVDHLFIPCDKPFPN